jgi:hypothetical protein
MHARAGKREIEVFMQEVELGSRQRAATAAAACMHVVKRGHWEKILIDCIIGNRR